MGEQSGWQISGTAPEAYERYIIPAIMGEWARALAESIVGIERQPGLFDAELPSEPIRVDLRRFHLERGRRFGDV